MLRAAECLWKVGVASLQQQTLCFCGWPEGVCAWQGIYFCLAMKATSAASSRFPAGILQGSRQLSAFHG